MYRIRLHGRGGQGIKTASRVLGAALFRSGFEVQDAPRYGAERRGAPIAAYVRAAKAPISERGVIPNPDLVVVADDTLVPIAAAGVLQGVGPATVLLIDSAEPAETWRRRLNLPGPVLVLARPAGGERAALQAVGAACAGAAARLLGVVAPGALADSVREEVAAFGAAAVNESLRAAAAAYESVARHGGAVGEGAESNASDYAPPRWIDLGLDAADVSAPAIHRGLTSVQVKTGLWRTMRPVIDDDRCNRCWWVCSTFCPDDAILVDAGGRPRIDYDHCKGCMICVAQCPPHAIRAVPEIDAAKEGRAKAEEVPA